MTQHLHSLLTLLRCDISAFEGKALSVKSPGNGKEIARLAVHSKEQAEKAIADAEWAFGQWREVPAPQRGELVRVLAEVLREHKETLAQLVTLECGKIIEEARGEVQEMIDICDFAVGLSRQIGGLTLPSERPEHVMEENWYPLGVVGVITAFNFPVAVWAWNAALALICGDAVVWKPSEKTPLTALAVKTLFDQAATQVDIEVPEGLISVVIGEQEIGEVLVQHPHVALLSATGSCAMGKAVGPKVISRFGKLLLELGGNNAVIVTPNADLSVAMPSIVFGAVGTAGQRCTTTRRAFVHRDIYDQFCQELEAAYNSLETKIGNPSNPHALIGPLIEQRSFEAMQHALTQAKAQGGKIYGGQRVLADHFPDAYYVQPAYVLMEEQTEIVMEETFAPILYVMPYDDLTSAMAAHNAVAQGLSSSIFTTDLREAAYFKQQSDCGIANVNIGTSGAEIGGAFGGEKETGGGRESGSDAWKAYMRRQTSTTYIGVSAPALAQGIRFGVDDE